MIKTDGSVIHFNNPKVQASPAANTFAISGHAETKQMNDIPGILSHLVSLCCINYMDKYVSSIVQLEFFPVFFHKHQ